ncbi:MAG: zinc ribbon domain-containing protein [Vicinamibacterales bacterium]
MHADIERLIALQRLDSAIHEAELTLAGEPARLQGLDTLLAEARARVGTDKDRVAQNASARRDIEKDVALHQGRLSKFRDQAMNVKTNQEYHAIQHEIAFAQNEIKTHEDRMLERMMESDELAGVLKASEAALATAVKDVESQRKAIAAEHDTLRARLEALKGERAALVAGISPSVLATFDLVSKRRNGVAVAEARDGICTVCHVRLRPQVFNTVRRNEEVLQCDSCQRILYFVPPAAAANAAT